jgi:hypothetical protein
MLHIHIKDKANLWSILNAFRYSVDVLWIEGIMRVMDAF